MKRGDHSISDAIYSSVMILYHLKVISSIFNIAVLFCPSWPLLENSSVSHVVVNVLAPADSAGGAGEEESLPGAGEPGQLLALDQAAHLILLLPRASGASCLSLAPHVVRQVAGVGPVCPDQLSLAHPRQRGVTQVTSRTCTQRDRFHQCSYRHFNEKNAF